MKAMVSTYFKGYAKREVVICEKVYHVEGIGLMLHRPVKRDRNTYSLWIVSDMETGLMVCSGLSEEYVCKKAEKLVSNHKEYMFKKKIEFFETAVFI